MGRMVNIEDVGKLLYEKRLAEIEGNDALAEKIQEIINLLLKKENLDEEKPDS